MDAKQKPAFMSRQDGGLPPPRTNGTIAVEHETERERRGAGVVKADLVAVIFSCSRHEGRQTVDIGEIRMQNGDFSIN
jgi:hypothetical protein